MKDLKQMWLINVDPNKLDRTNNILKMQNGSVKVKQLGHHIEAGDNSGRYSNRNNNVEIKKIMDDIIRMIRDGSEEEREMVKKIVPAIDYRKKKHLLWKLATEVSGYMYRFNRDKDLSYWIQKSEFNSYSHNTAEDMIKQLEEEECLDTESFRYLEPIVRKEISINNRELYTFKVQVKEEYRKYLKIKK